MLGDVANPLIVYQVKVVVVLARSMFAPTLSAAAMRMH